MNKRVRFILDTLEHYFPNPPIPLNHSDPYTLLIAVLLSAQCTDARVNQVTPHLFELANTPEKMACQAPETVEKIIKSCGLGPTKAKAIVRLSKDLLAHHNGHIPNTLEELEKLPGVGHKTASVVLIQAFQKPAFPVDTHIHRCAKRWGLSNGISVVHTEKDLKKSIPKKYWKKVHLQIIYFARAYCPAKKHDPFNCPICSHIAIK